jgi:hypothetical protein
MIMKYFDAAPGWATPVIPVNDYASLAKALGHEDGERACLARRQGKCPGLEFCPDCRWQEGTSRD